jgi:hypothetical protein
MVETIIKALSPEIAWKLLETIKAKFQGATLIIDCFENFKIPGSDKAICLTQKTIKISDLETLKDYLSLHYPKVEHIKANYTNGMLEIDLRSSSVQILGEIIQRQDFINAGLRSQIRSVEYKEFW